jgi:hypothetical protein
VDLVFNRPIFENIPILGESPFNSNDHSISYIKWVKKTQVYMAYKFINTEPEMTVI